MRSHVNKAASFGTKSAGAVLACRCYTFADPPSETTRVHLSAQQPVKLLAIGGASTPSPELQGPRKRKPRMAPVFWLVLSLQAGLMHVGNFPTLETCQAAAKTAWSSSNVVAFTCVQASTGKEGDPRPPPS
jgi:hypothetical protein